MERSLICRSISKEAHDNIFTMCIFQSESCSDRNRNSSSYNSVGSQHSDGHIRDMHGAALSFTVSCFPCHKLRKHLLHIRSLCDTVSMSSVRGSNIILI